jgi:hypothetical protein
VLPPEVVRDVGNGSLEKGERVLDLFVRKVREDAQHLKPAAAYKTEFQTSFFVDTALTHPKA